MPGDERVRHGSEATVWYLGIGSNMNPDKMRGRKIFPAESCPVRCVDFERRFWGKYGMAEVNEKPGAEFHAVLHRITPHEMATLDSMERGYIRKDVTCYTYGTGTDGDGRCIVATGYQFDAAKLMLNAATPPSERYKKLMVDGMRHYGCSPEAIAEMEATPTQESVARAPN